MSYEEKNLPEEEKVEQTVDNEDVEVKTAKKLPLGVLIGIIAGAVCVVVAIVLAIVLLGGNNGGNDNGDGGDQKPCTHVDADDDYFCDNCHKNFDDGDEYVAPTDTDVEVTFTVLYDDGTPLAGAKFTLTQGDKTYTFTSGDDGTVKGKVAAYAYYVTFDSLPEYCQGETYGVDFENGATSATLTVKNNKPDGSAQKPIPATDEPVEITLEAGQEIYYSAHGASLRYLTIVNNDLVVTYNGESYIAVDGVITVPILSENVETPTVFSVKNPTDESVTVVMSIAAPLGSNDNPHALTENSAVVPVTGNKTVYYKLIADKAGVLILTSPTNGHEISVTRTVYTTNDDGEQVALRTTNATSSDESCAYIYVAKGDEIKIGVSYIGEGGEDEVHDVEFSADIYAGGASNSAPILEDSIYILLDAGSSVEFLADKTAPLTINVEGDVSISVNGQNFTANSDGSFELSVTEGDLISVSVSADAIAKITINK